MAKDYRKTAEDILSMVGGKENVTECVHCMTRLRVKVKDKSLIDEEGITGMDEVPGALWAGDQYQIVLGNTVNSVYDEICTLGGFEKHAGIDENLDQVPAKKTKRGFKGSLLALISVISDCIVPNLGIFVAMGLFAAIISVIGPNGFKLATEESVVYKLIDSCYQGIQYFIPVMLGLAAAKRFKVDTKVAVIVLCICLFPDLVNAVSGGEIGFIPITLNSQGMSAILIVWIMSYIERLVKKILPDSLKFVFSNFLVILIMVPLSIFILIPAGFLLGLAIATPVQMLGNISEPLLAAVVGALWIPLISFGLHAAMAGIFMMDFMQTGVNYTLMPAMYSLAFIGIATDLAIAIRAKDKKTKESGRIGMLNYLTGGIAEPSIYSIYLKNPKTLIAISAGMAACGFYMSLVKAGAYAISANNVLGLLTFLAGGMDNLMKALPGVAIGMAVPFLLIMILGVESKKK